MKVFIKIYMNNVVIKAKFLIKHFFNFRSLVQLFVKYNISISSIKTLFDYLNVNLFKQRVNFIKLFIFKNKFEVIKAIKYSSISKSLKHYFNLINYFRNNVYYYT